MITKNQALKLFLLSFFVILILFIPSVISQPSPSVTINVIVKEYGKPERTDTTAQIHTSLTSKEGRNCLLEKIGNIYIDIREDALTPIGSPNCTHIQKFCAEALGIPTANLCLYNLDVCMDETNTEITFNCNDPDVNFMGAIK